MPEYSVKFESSDQALEHVCATQPLYDEDPAEQSATYDTIIEWEKEARNAIARLRSMGQTPWPIQARGQGSPCGASHPTKSAPSDRTTTARPAVEVREIQP